MCGAKEEREIDAKGHSYGEPVVVTPATETSAGKQTRTCAVCGDVPEESNGGSNLWWILAVVAAVIIIVGGLTMFFVAKKRKNSSEE